MSFLKKVHDIFITSKNTEDNISPGKNRFLASGDDEEKNKRISSLTVREKDTFLLLLEGYTLKEVAKQLNIKYSTVNTHMTSIYKKLGVSTRAELIISYRMING